MTTSIPRISRRYSLLACLLVLLSPFTLALKDDNNSFNATRVSCFSAMPKTTDGCTAPYFALAEGDDVYQLVVDVSNVSRRDLNVDVDYDVGTVRVSGDIVPKHSSQYLRRSAFLSTGVPTCIFQEWNVLREKAALEDLTMELDEGLLVLTVPKKETQDQQQQPSSSSSSSSVQEVIVKRTKPLSLMSVVKAKAYLRGRRQQTDNHDDATRVNATLADERRAKILSTVYRTKPILLANVVDKLQLVSQVGADEEEYWMRKM